MGPELAQRARQVLIEGGVAAAGYAALTPTWFDARVAARQVARGEGIAGHFTFRHPASSALPTRRIPWARWHLTVALGYDLAEAATGPAVAGYAEVDLYGRLRELLERVRALVTDAGGRAMVVADTNLAFDKALARRAGVGVVGHHTMILVPGYGARVVLGSLVSDVPVAVVLGPRFRRHPCGTCQRCLTACPVGALIAPGVLDATRCLATLAQEPQLTPGARAALGTRVYGCDDCLRACPIGARHEHAGSAPLSWILEATDEEIVARAGHWYLPQRDPFYARRNLVIALGNSHQPSARAVLARTCLVRDPRLRREALRSWLRLGIAARHPWGRLTRGGSCATP
jgi:epoxyqueuosine reductase